MRLRTDLNGCPRKIKLPDMNEPVKFSKNGYARCKKHDGKILLEKLNNDHFWEIDDDDS